MGDEAEGVSGVQVYVSRSTIDAGDAGDGPRQVEVYTVALPRFEPGEEKKRGPLTFKTKKELKPLPLPYIIWPVREGNQSRFRWARRHLGKRERIGIASHGAAPTLQAAVSACLQNHVDRLKVQEDAS